MKIFRRWLQKTNKESPAADKPVSPPSMERKSPSLFDQTPDQPDPFGYKVSWFALKTSDPASVLDALELGEGTLANWSSGMAAVYARDEDR